MDRTIKIIPLGGSGTVTNNMYVYESPRDIVIVDCGIGFPSDNLPGVDVTIPDVTYLMDKKDKIRGIVITHGHEDHFGGLPFILPQIGEHIPIHTAKLTAGFIKEKVKEFAGLNLSVNVVKDRQPIHLGDFEIKMLPVTHSVPDTKHLVIKTPLGTIYHGSDFKFDWTPVNSTLPDVQSITKAGAEGIALLLSDSLRSEKDGYSLSESTVEDSFEREFRDQKGRILITTMSSSISRIQQALWVARRHNRKVAFVGFSMERNVKVANALGFLDLPPRLIVDKRKIDGIPRDELCLIVAGSQGQSGSSLTRIADSDHDIQLEAGDKVIFSADPIPGNEANVYHVIDALARQGVLVSYTDLHEDLHVSGHASARELMMLMALTKPKNVMPIGGTYRHLVQYAKLAEKMKIPSDNTFVMEEGDTLELLPGEVVRRGEKITLKEVYVEGGEVSSAEHPMEDRQLMYQEGVIVAVVSLDEHDHFEDLILIPKGFSKPLTPEIKKLAVEKVTKLLVQSHAKDRYYLREKVAAILNRLVIEKNKKNPLIIPIVVKG